MSARVVVRLTHAQAHRLSDLAVQASESLLDSPRDAVVLRRAARAIDDALAAQEERRLVRELYAEAEARARVEGLDRGTPPWLVPGPDGQPF